MIWRVLTHEEAATVPGMISPIPDSLVAIGAVDENGVAACIGTFPVLHADPVWVREDLRGHGKTLLRLWEKTRENLAERGLRGIEVLMTENVPGPPLEETVARMCEHVGGKEFRVRAFVLPVEA